METDIIKRIANSGYLKQGSLGTFNFIQILVNFNFNPLFCICQYLFPRLLPLKYGCTAAVRT